jgi:hypothetical protein
VAKSEVSGGHAEAEATGVKKRVIGLVCLRDGHGQDTDFCEDASTVWRETVSPRNSF